MSAVCAADVRGTALRARLLARVRAAAVHAAAGQDAVLAAELEALESAAPGGWEECEVPDPYCGPPDGDEAWLADLPAELMAEYVAATEDRPCPEAIVAGRLPRPGGDGCGFAAGGAADDLAAGAALAGLTGRTYADGLDRLDDDELIGVLRAARRLASWSAGMELAAVADLAARRTAEAEAAGDCAPAEHIGDELAAALTLTARASDALLDLALALRRLPATMAALATGAIDRHKAAVIADELGGLRDADAARVEAEVVPDAPGQTTGQLRAATRRAVLRADPAAARERKERAEREARVEKWGEQAGTAALAGRDLPPAEVLAADQNLSALARSLRHAGADGTMDQLRAQVYLALLTCQPLTALLPPSASGPPGDSGTARSPAPPRDCSPMGSVNLTMPLATWLGLSDAPGTAAGHGPLDAADARQLAALLARQPGTAWCLTLTGQRGKPVAHGCARACPPGVSRLPGPSQPPDALAWLDGITIGKLETGECCHSRESPAYRPPPSLRHLITIRQPACSFPGCRRPAVRCDQDHTIPHHQGGRTCECNLAPLCRRHHRAKQARGWWLDQPEPGVMVWRLPHGRTYRVEQCPVDRDCPPGGSDVPARIDGDVVPGDVPGAGRDEEPDRRRHV